MAFMINMLSKYDE